MKHRHGGNIYGYGSILDFSANINPLGMPKAVREAIAGCADACLHYPDPDAKSLREAIAKAEGIPAEAIICGNGAAELIYLLSAALQPKKAVLLAPAFAEYEESLLPVGCQTCFYECRKSAGFVPDEAYLDLLTEDVDIAFLCNPNNPTGAYIPKELLKSIRRKCLQNKIFLVLDECFLDFTGESKERSLIPELSAGGLFILKAFTKIYAMPGLRLGYGMTYDRELLFRMQKARQPWSVSVPAQLSGIAALSEEGFVEKTVCYVREERAFLKGGMENLGIRVYPGEANYLFFETGDPLFGKKLEEKGILIRDCSNYRGLTPGYYRIAVRTRQENEKLLEAIASIRNKGE